MATNPTTSTTTGKAPGVKLTPHARGWVAKIGGRVRWLAPLDKPDLALERYWQKRRKWEDEQSARPVSHAVAGLGQLGDLFLGAKAAAVAAGELKARTARDYEQGIQQAVDHFGYETNALDIPAGRWGEYRAALAGRLDPHSLARHVGAVRALSKWAHLNEYIDRPFRFGTVFNLPSQKAMRKAKAEAGVRLFDSAQVKAIRAKCDDDLDALFLLALNGGIGNTDLANLRRGNVDLAAEELRFSRSKTDVPRAIPLWPETVAALEKALAAPRSPKDPADADRVFLTPKGHPLVRDHFDAAGVLTSTTDSIGMRFAAVAKEAGVPRSFYDARRTFQTLGDEVGPEHVVRAIMGHAARGDDMGARYRQAIDRTKLDTVVMHVRERLGFAAGTSGRGRGGSKRGGAGRPSSSGGRPGSPRRRPARTASGPAGESPR